MRGHYVTWDSPHIALDRTRSHVVICACGSRFTGPDATAAAAAFDAHTGPPAAVEDLWPSTVGAVPPWKDAE